jgi:hypothetical protein
MGVTAFVGAVVAAFPGELLDVTPNAANTCLISVARALRSVDRGAPHGVAVPACSAFDCTKSLRRACLRMALQALRAASSVMAMQA